MNRMIPFATFALVCSVGCFESVSSSVPEGTCVPVVAVVPANESDEGGLVAGEVVAVDLPAKGPPREATVKVLHVYSGPKSLKGTTFIQFTAAGASAGKGSYIVVPMLEVGEKGLWYVGKDSVTGNKSQGYMQARKAHPEHNRWTYDQMIEWAESVGQLSKLKIGERLNESKELCGHKNPAVAQYAIEILCGVLGSFGGTPADVERAGVPEFIKGVAKNPKVTIAALVRADQLFLDDRKLKWQESDERKLLLDRFTELLTEEDAKIATDYLVCLPRPKTLSDFEVSLIMEKIATNSKQSPAVRRVVVREVGESSNPFAFDLLVRVVKNDADNTVRLQAAQGIVNPWRKFTPAQQAILRKLIADEKDADVTKALHAALDKSK